MSAEEDREPVAAVSARASMAAGAVFLSYASEDVAAAERIATALRAGGIEVWFDKSELRGGDAWDRQIREQIHDCRLFMPVISANSERRDEGYFRREWALAADRTRDMAHKRAFLVPVVIDSTPERGASVPDKFHELQWTRLPDGRTPPEFVERVRRLLAPDALHARPATSGTGSTTAPPPPASPGQSSRPKPVLWVIGAVLVVALSYFVVDKLWWSKRTAAVTSSAFPPSAAVPEKSIAVLPFVDLSEKHDQGYFADGLAEEILDLLAKIPGLRVIGRTSSFQFRDKVADVRSIGSALGAAYVLEGSIRRSGDQVRVTAQLISTADGSHRWSDTYDGRFDDLFKLQDSIAADLARTLEVAIGSFETDARRSTTPEAYDLYMQGIQALDVNSEESANRAIALLTESLRADPKSSRTLDALAYAYGALGEEDWMPPDKAFEKARALAKESLSVDKGDGRAHEVLGLVAAVYDWDWQRAQDEFTTALALSHRSSEVLVNAAEMESALGHWDKAMSLLQEALAKDPLSADAHMVLGAWVYMKMGRFAEAEASMRRALQIRPHWGSGRYFLASCLVMQGRLQEALQEAESEKPRDGKYQAMSLVLYAMNRKPESDAALSQAISENATDWPASIARVYAFRGESTEALAWLDRAYKVRDADLYWIKGDPVMRKLEPDPRYKAFLRKINLPE